MLRSRQTAWGIGTMSIRHCFRAALASCLMPALLACSSPAGQAPEPDPFADAHGPYLGQTPPGSTPAVFAPGLISQAGDQAGVLVSPGGREVHFWTVEATAGSTEARSTIYVTREEGGSWTAPVVASFSGVYNDMYPALRPDGSRLYFQSDRPIDSAESTFKYNLWYVEREGAGWSEARSMGRPINGRDNTGGPSVTADGTFYFTIMTLGGLQEIYRSRYVDGEYREPERLPDEVNAQRQQSDSYVAPDESFLVFYAVEGSGGHGNPAGLWVSFRDESGGWSGAQKLGLEINSDANMGPATVTPDGKYVFFSRPNHAANSGLDVYWVGFEAIEKLRS
jgi:hypothetical protein